MAMELQTKSPDSGPEAGFSVNRKPIPTNIFDSVFGRHTSRPTQMMTSSLVPVADSATAPWSFSLDSSPRDSFWRSTANWSEPSALSRTLALERNAITFDRVAAAILGRIYDRGHATCEELAQWLESPEEWIAFSRLQRSRLLQDSGTEFTVSREGQRLVKALLGEGVALAR